jgi:hypothetical protein
LTLCLKCLIRKKRVLKTSLTGGAIEYDWNGPLRFFAELVVSHRIATALIFLSFAVSIFALGVRSPDYFGRFGAFFVLAAIWLAHSVNRKIGTEIETKAFSQMFDVSVDAARKGAVAAATYSDKRSAFTPKLPEYKKLPAGQYSSIAEKISSKGSKRKKPFLYLELVLGVWGTVQWSFGDELARKLCEFELC